MAGFDLAELAKKGRKLEPDKKMKKAKEEIKKIQEETGATDEQIVEALEKKIVERKDKKKSMMKSKKEEPVKEEKPQPKKSKIVKTPKKSEVPNIIAILWGYDGTSKSEQIMKFKPKPMIIDLENKLEPLAQKLGFPLENIVVASQYNEKYEILGGNTLQTIREMLTNVRKRIRDKGDVSAIALDGISDIRPYAVEEWLEENPNRKNPSTPGDWRDINDKVRDICFQLINIGRVEKISIFFTAQVSGEYIGNNRVRDVPDCKTWITHNVDHKFKMERDDNNHVFTAFCEKSYYDPFFTIDLTDWSHEEKPSLLNMLQDLDVLKEYIQKSEEGKKERVKESMKMMKS